MKRDSKSELRRRQMDLGLRSNPPALRRPRRPCSRERAAWWFEQMRRAVAADGEW